MHSQTHAATDVASPMISESINLRCISAPFGQLHSSASRVRHLRNSTHSVKAPWNLVDDTACRSVCFIWISPPPATIMGETFSISTSIHTLDKANDSLFQNGNQE